MTRKGKARLIIGTFAATAGAWSGATAYIPIAGPLLADTAGLTAISVAMAYALSALYGKSVGTAGLVAFSSVVLGAILGNLGLKALSSLVPIYGSAVNAGITITLHTAIGLAICKIYDEGRNLADISKEEFLRIINENKEKAEKEKEEYNKAFNALSPEKQKRIKALQKRLKDKKLSDFELDEINKEIEDIFNFSMKENE